MKEVISTEKIKIIVSLFTTKLLQIIYALKTDYLNLKVIVVIDTNNDLWLKINFTALILNPLLHNVIK